MSEFLKPLPVDSAGLITNYKCTFQCKHCLYCSSPKIEEEVSEEVLREIIEQLETASPRVDLHIGGGEPLIDFERAKRIISYIKTKKITLEYMETNGFLLLKEGVRKLRELKEAGLLCMLLSISPFHNEFISFDNTKKVFEEIVSVFGEEGIFPWHTGYFYFLKKVSPEKPVKLEDFFKNFSKEEILYQLTSVMYIQPGGRAAYLFSDYMDLHPPEMLFKKDCSRNLSSPVHAHIDYRGNYITGFCSGLRIGKETALDMKKLFNEGISLSDYPLLGMLAGGGLKDLYDFALARGYKPRPEGYVAPCHLCLDIRVYLYFNDKKYPELYPDFFYEELNHELARIEGFQGIQGIKQIREIL